MNWKTRFFLLAIVSVPAFSGYPLHLFGTPILPGITQGWLGYWITANMAIFCILGGAHLANVIAVAALVTMPVVFVGGGISRLMQLLGLGQPGGPAAYSAHYLTLCVTMLTVIPLALSLVAVVPFHEIEQHLLGGKRGISRLEKYLLMFLRVFNHVIYFVIPNIMEVMREEGHLRIGGEKPLSKPGLRSVIRAMIRIGIEGICAAMQYIPLWAVEISRLPARRRGSSHDSNPSGK